MSTSQEVGVVLAALGNWDVMPELSGPFNLTLEDVDSEWREGIIDRGWETGALSRSLLAPLRRCTKVVYAELTFQPYVAPEEESGFPSLQLRWARAAAKLLKQLAQAGAAALYFDGSMKVYTPEQLELVEPKDSASLFHLFVEIWGDDVRVCAEGLSIFGLPELVITGIDPSGAAAQATAFSAAAQMICEGRRLLNGETFQASESFPWFSVHYEKEPTLASERLRDLSSEQGGEGAAEELSCSCGLCHLTPVTED